MTLQNKSILQAFETELLGKDLTQWPKETVMASPVVGNESGNGADRSGKGKRNQVQLTK